MSVHILGIRHHGPGSARSVREALVALAPDCLLVEGPPEAESLLPLLIHPEMRPPVALLLYTADEKQPREGRTVRCVFYPFALFSPEWQALHYALTRGIPVQLMDLPQAVQMAEPPEEEPADEPSPDAAQEMRQDPLRWLAAAAGAHDGEQWWERMVEQRQDSSELFTAILEAMTALREASAETPLPLREARREAAMRQAIRKAQKAGYTRIAVVCGAWHAPALAQLPTAARDAALLRGLRKVQVRATWVPWSAERLAWNSGYGAGIASPGWYQHLWESGERRANPEAVAIGWMTRVARLLREQDLDVSSAHIIEAVRLAEALAALRGHALPGLPELNDATLSVFCSGDTLSLQLIERKLIIGEALGQVPEETPMVPLQQDFLREQKRLRLPAEPVERALDLDLRKPTDLERSHLLHRLALLGIPWGRPERVTGKSGTFHELWTLQWEPAFAVLLVEAGVWGNSVAEAATARVRDVARQVSELATLTRLLETALLAALPDAVGEVMARLQDEAALSSDVARLMDALPPLANVLRYGNVRQTDARMVESVVEGLFARICIGLPGACASLNDEAAADMYGHLLQVQGAVALLQHAAYVTAWQGVLRQLADQEGLHGLLAGRCVRLLWDAGVLEPKEGARRMGLALSTANEPTAAAAWLEGFLRGSGLLLLHDEALWELLDRWVSGLAGDTFTTLLPLLRRTFATFPTPERRQMGERVRHVDGPLRRVPVGVDPERAARVLPLLARVLGIERQD